MNTFASAVFSFDFIARLAQAHRVTLTDLLIATEPGATSGAIRLAGAGLERGAAAFGPNLDRIANSFLVNRGMLLNAAPENIFQTEARQSLNPDLNIGRFGNSGTFFNVASDGVRGEFPLTLEQRIHVQNYLSKFDMSGVTVRWVDDRNLNTAFGDMFGERILNIGSDVVPGNVGVGTLTANSRVSINGTLAHELVGHGEAAMAGRTQDLLYLEEAQASIRAARFGPDLTSTERFTLLRDAITRLQNAPGGPIRIRDVKDLLYIQYR